MNILDETFTLNTGATIPKIGFGTWQIPNGEDAYNSTALALKNGYRHIDTALVYGNEASVGKAIRDSGIDRSDLFITTKLPAEIKDASKVQEAFETSMINLDLEYVDLYLVHAPWPWAERGADYRKENGEVWTEMEAIYATGRAKAIGVSNFVVSDLEALFETAKVVPAVNQIRYFIGNTQADTVGMGNTKGILTEAYSPLATGDLLDNEDIQAIADKYGKSVAQISLRFVLQNDLLPLPKSTNEDRIKQNADLNFEISAEDMEFLNSLELSL